MENPLISVVVPVYGVEKYIARFATSLFRQTYDKLQLIFVNDGTKDRSIDILNELIDNEFPSWREKVVIVSKKNGGVAAARMTGLELVMGDYFINLDSDDYLETTMFEEFAEAIRLSGSDMIYCDYVQHFSDGDRYFRWKTYQDTETVLYDLFRRRLKWCIWTKCFKTSLLKENKFYCPVADLGDDMVISSQLVCLSGSFHHIDKCLYHYDFTNETSISHNISTDSLFGLMDNYYLLGEIAAKEAQYGLLKKWTHSNFFTIGYHIMKRQLEVDVIDRFPAARDYILSAPFRSKQSGGISLLRQLRIKAWFLKLENLRSAGAKRDLDAYPIHQPLFRKYNVLRLRIAQ